MRCARVITTILQTEAVEGLPLCHSERADTCICAAGRVAPVRGLRPLRAERPSGSRPESFIPPEGTGCRWESRFEHGEMLRGPSAWHRRVLLHTQASRAFGFSHYLWYAL